MVRGPVRGSTGGDCSGRHPRRGDIVVFKTKGILGIHDQDQFYIKRLVGLPGETVSIGDDQHARINGQRLDSSTPHFENIYGFNPEARQREGRFGQYNGHILQPRMDSLLRSPTDAIEVRPDHFVVFAWIHATGVISRSKM